MIANKVNETVISTKPKVFKQYFHEETGSLHHIDVVQTFGSGFQVRNFTLMSDGYNPEPITFKLTAENVRLVEGIDVGATVRVIFQVRGREWEGKFFNNLEARSLEIFEGKEQSDPITETKENIPF